MPYVITDACIKDELCIKACVRKAIHPKRDEPEFANVRQLFINPKKCLDCGTCAEVCESGAIFPVEELPEDKQQFIEMNAAFYRKQ